MTGLPNDIGIYTKCKAKSFILIINSIDDIQEASVRLTKYLISVSTGGT